jgi:hypothetical protein
MSVNPAISPGCNYLLSWILVHSDVIRSLDRVGLHVLRLELNITLISVNFKQEKS